MVSKRGGSKSKKDKEMLPANSPITISGGGGRGPYMHITFDHTVYVPDPEDPSSFVNPGKKVSRILVNGVAPVEDDGTPVIVNENSEVVIKYRKGTNDRLKIYLNDGIFGVRFKGVDLPFDYTKATGDTHHGPTLELRKVKIDNTAVKLDRATGATNTITVETK